MGLLAPVEDGSLCMDHVVVDSQPADRVLVVIARTRVAEEFRSRDRVVLFTSDVSARGVDYPDVSLVVQVSSQLIGPAV